MSKLSRITRNAQYGWMVWYRDNHLFCGTNSLRKEIFETKFKKLMQTRQLISLPKSRSQTEVTSDQNQVHAVWFQPKIKVWQRVWAHQGLENDTIWTQGSGRVSPGRFGLGPQHGLTLSTFCSLKFNLKPFFGQAKTKLFYNFSQFNIINIVMDIPNEIKLDVHTKKIR